MITTTRILADKALGKYSGQSCVDWAVEMLVQGRDGYYLAILASMPPNDIDIVEYRDLALAELQIESVSKAEAINLYAAELLRSAYEGKADLMSTLRNVKDMCIEFDYAKNLYDFYLLYFAYDDLQSSEVQWYWKGANRGNINSIIRDRIHTFLITTGEV